MNHGSGIDEMAWVIAWFLLPAALPGLWAALRGMMAALAAKWQGLTGPGPAAS